MFGRLVLDADAFQDPWAMVADEENDNVLVLSSGRPQSPPPPPPPPPEIMSPGPYWTIEGYWYIVTMNPARTTTPMLFVPPEWASVSVTELEPAIVVANIFLAAGPQYPHGGPSGRSLVQFWWPGRPFDVLGPWHGEWRREWWSPDGPGGLLIAMKAGLVMLPGCMVASSPAERYRPD